MTNLKKYNDVLKLFVIFLTFLATLSCNKQIYQVTKIEGKQLPISESSITTFDSQFEIAQNLEKFITPYRDHITKDLDSVIAYSPETLDKNSAKWQSNLGNLMADACIKIGNKIFYTLEKKNVDLCILNYGGIRSILPKGDVRIRTVFEIMPFENRIIVVALKTQQIYEMLNYFIAAKKAHPLSGITFMIGKNNEAKNIIISGKPIENNTVYYVLTNDYLANGGDNMFFFEKGIQKFDLDYKIRNILIDYFKEIKIIPVLNDVRVSVE